MSKFLVTYHGGPPPDASQMDEIKAAFGAWLQSAGKAVTDPGAPLRNVGQVANGAPEAKVAIGGYSIVEAADTKAALAILKSHPFVARGGTLQVDEVLEI